MGLYDEPYKLNLPKEEVLKPGRDPRIKPGYTIITEIQCYHKRLRSTLEITIQPMLPHLRERAEELMLHPDPSHPDVQKECQELSAKIIARRHTSLGHHEWHNHHREQHKHHLHRGDHKMARHHAEQAEHHKQHIRPDFDPENPDPRPGRGK